MAPELPHPKILPLIAFCCLFLALLLPPTSAHLPQERDYSLVVDAGKEECFFEEVVKGNTLTVEYQVFRRATKNLFVKKISFSQVIDGGDEMTSELDINFKLLSPRGHPLVGEFKKSDGTHSHQIEVSNLWAINKLSDIWSLRQT